MYLTKENLPAAAGFVAGGLWGDMKRALNDRRPPAPASTAMPSEAAQQFFLRRGFEMALEEIEKLPRELDPAATPLIPPAILDTRD